MRTGRALVALAVALAAGTAAPLDPPHDASMQSQGCKACHTLHFAPGASLTNQAGNYNVCDQCHGSVVDGDGRHFGFPWVPQIQAVPGAGGRSHRWDANATNRGARVPTEPEMAKRIEDGKIECSTCHDQHNNGGRPGDLTFHAGRQHVGGNAGAAGSVQVGTAWAPNGPPAGAGNGQLRLETVTASAAPKGYRIQLTAATATNVTFKITHDRATSWFAWSGSAWVADTTGTGAGRTVALSTVVDLDDGANVRVSFPSGAGYRANDYWEFYVTYPFLRASNAADAMCLDCHADRAHSALRVEGGDATHPANGVNYFSHPVGEALTRPYDRAVILDANGSPQTASGADADGNATNNLNLDATGKVRCTSCHAVHNADSNSLTVEPR